MPFYIKWLKSLQINQFLREEGPASHAHKAKTPTMGGLVFIITTFATTVGMSVIPGVPGMSHDISYYAVIITGVLCGIVGLIDDSAKVIQKANKGISAYVRLGTETVFGVVLALVLVALNDNRLIVPSAIYSILHGQLGTMPDITQPVAIMILPAIVFIALSAFLTAATTNAVNLHDGMDGLAAGTACQIFAAMAVILFMTGSDAPVQYGYATISATAAGALMGFLLFNKNPAQIFMGDTGSLFIGGLMACIVLAGGITIWFVPLSLIYILEALSVMAQVIYFKLTKQYTPEKPMSAIALIMLKLTKKLPGEGKRLFRMAPLHHHYEAVMAEKGWAEWQVVLAFWGVQFLLCAAVLLNFHYR